MAGSFAMLIAGCQTIPEKAQESFIADELDAALKTETMAAKQVKKPPQDVQMLSCRPCLK